MSKATMTEDEFVQKVEDGLAAIEEYRTTPARYALDLKLSLADILERGLKARGWTVAKLAQEAGMSTFDVDTVLYSEVYTFETAGKLLHALGIRAEIVERIST